MTTYDQERAELRAVMRRAIDGGAKLVADEFGDDGFARDGALDDALEAGRAHVVELADRQAEADGQRNRWAVRAAKADLAVWQTRLNDGQITLAQGKAEAAALTDRVDELAATLIGRRTNRTARLRSAVELLADELADAFVEWWQAEVGDERDAELERELAAELGDDDDGGDR